jgi:heme A synthase
MIRITPLLVLVIDLLAVWDVLKSNKELEKKILWIVIIILVPLFGALGWYAVSRKIINL